MADSRIFEIEAPVPLRKIEGAIQRHETNLEAIQIHRQHGDVRKILSAKQLKEYVRLYKKINAQLESNGVWELISQYEALRDDWNALKAQAYELHKKLEAGDNPRRVKSKLAIIHENRESIRADVKAMNQKLAPYRRWITRARRLEARIQEHYAGVKDEEINKRYRKQLATEANYIVEILVHIMNGLDYCFRTTVNGKERIYSVKASRIVVTPDTVQIRLQTVTRGLFGGIKNHIPRGVDLVRLVKTETVLAQLSASTGMEVTCPQVESNMWYQGIWLRINRTGMKDGLLDRVLYSDFVRRYPNDKRHLLPVPTGLAEGLWTKYINLIDQPHLLITGQNGSGKSNAMHSWLCTLITHHSPKEVQFIMIDLKEGIDLNSYKGIPHIIGDVIEDARETAAVMLAIEKERVRRMQELKKAGARNINDYNRNHPDYWMPHIIVVFDEYGALAAGANREWSGIVYNISAQLAMKARAAGIHLVIGAQTPRKEHVPPDIRDNITFRLSGRQATLGGSLAATGSKAANELEKVPGRFWCEDGRDAYQVQMAYITDDEIDRAIRQANEWERVPVVALAPTQDESPDTTIEGVIAYRKPFSHEEFVDVCLNSLAGVINYTEVYALVKGDYDVSARQVQRIADNIKRMDILEHRGKTYELISKGRGKVLVETELTAEATQDNVPPSAD